jgi:hypothetical protein
MQSGARTIIALPQSTFWQNHFGGPFVRLRKQTKLVSQLGNQIGFEPARAQIRTVCKVMFVEAEYARFWP